MRINPLFLFIITSACVSGCSSSRQMQGIYKPAIATNNTVTMAGNGGIVSNNTALSGAANGSVKAPDYPSVQNRNALVMRRALVETAMKYKGCKYKLGASGPKRFDCSGFTSFVYKQYGIALNRTSSDQYLQGTAINDMRELKPGDLVFWRGRDAKSKRVGHVGIVVEADPNTGNFSFIHAAMTGVQIDQSVTFYYRQRFVGARRIIAES